MKHKASTYCEEAIQIVELSSQNSTIKIAINIGCTLYSWKYKDTEIIYFNDTLKNYQTHKKLAGVPFMHPWSNRLESDFIFEKAFTTNDAIENILHRDANNLPLHGLILKSTQWKLEALKEEENYASMRAEIIFDDENLLTIFPYKHKVQLEITLANDMVSYSVQVDSLDDKPMPLAFGFHPYFNLQNSTQNKLTIPDSVLALVDDKMIPTYQFLQSHLMFNIKNNILNIDNRKIDHAFIHTNNEVNYKLETTHYNVEFILDNDYKVVQIYYPNNEEKPYICIEPMLAKANAFNHSKYLETKRNQYTINFKMSAY
jgi:aldose 1-epimerase